MKKPNIITDKTRRQQCRGDDRYWHPREDKIQSSMSEIAGNRYEEIFGYSYHINGKYYDHNFKEVKRGESKES